MNKVQAESYSPSYIVKRDPTRFGSRQDDYLAQSRQIIEQTAQKITACKENKGDLQKLFFELLGNLSKKRAQIAKEHQTEDAEDFGKRRDDYYPGQTSTIVLNKTYQEYGDKMLTLFSKYLKGMEIQGGFKKEHKIEDVCSGRVSTLQFEVLTEKDLRDKSYTQHPQSYLPDYISYHLLGNKKNKEWTPEEISDYRAKFLKFKAEQPEQYRLKRINSALLVLSENCPSPSFLGLTEQQVRETYPQEITREILGNLKSLFVRAVLRMDIDGKMYAISEYYTWMYENGEWLKNKTESEHPINRMQRRSKVMILHQDEYSIQKTLEDIAQIFESAVSWNKNTHTLSELKDKMALLAHRITHNIRDVRGAAAENEWLMESILLALGVKCTTPANWMVDLEAFTNPLFSDFRKVYDQQTDFKLS